MGFLTAVTAAVSKSFTSANDDFIFTTNLGDEAVTAAQEN